MQLKWQARQVARIAARRHKRKEWRCTPSKIYQAHNFVFFSSKEAAALLGKSVETIRKWRAKNYGPHFSRQPDGSVVYEKKDIETWLENNA